MEDRLIIKNIKLKKECGLEMFIDKYGGLIKAIIRKKLFDYSFYEDECLDDILLAIWNNVERFDSGKGTLRNWVISVTRYKIIDYNRKYVGEKEKTSDLEITDDKIQNLKAPSEEVDRKLLRYELNEEIDELLGRLNKTDKELFIKHYLEEKPVHKISEEVGVHTNVLYNRLSRGRKKLKAIMLKSNLF
ncbi:MAG: sigma-70 family RNA polymerase sigma factor [Sarcina sp.]